ncbi:hypothetical protein GCM10010371_63550 [Streptomyces subrutilus]|uniref:Uncharacterized protein n=1 Tax=Streptomyces subrutilus TaxID=36818 RepID=A0A918RE40_9ACTN|nr:hypothetical protein [Streptomyces subrutilus]GGZ94969.1 hypothetical protein GCM10010371_63550 [Streptomyces subrutilus]
MPFHIRLRFGPPSSTAVTGTWHSEATAERKFRGFIGRYGSQADVRIELVEDGPQGEHTVRSWTRERGEVEGA